MTIVIEPNECECVPSEGDKLLLGEGRDGNLHVELVLTEELRLLYYLHKKKKTTKSKPCNSNLLLNGRPTQTHLIY
jgi:hypothetical protein